MRLVKLAGLAVLATGLAVPVGAQAAAPDGLGPWADFVVESSQGTQAGGGDISVLTPLRSDPLAALGVAERNTTEGNFFSLGFKNSTAGGHIILGFDNKICDGGSADLDLELVEATIESDPNVENSSYPSELVDVYVSPDNVTYTLVAAGVNKDELLELPGTVTVAQHYVKLVDRTRIEDYIGPTAPRQRPDADGYDVDGVQALNTSGCNELVGTGRMTGGGSLFLPSGTRVTHGFTLRCNDPQSGGNDLEVNWNKGDNFHSETINSLQCLDTALDEGHPVAGFDTIVGKVTGRFNGVSGYTAEFTLTDEGEPGSGDFGDILIKDPFGAEVLHVTGDITKGNQQAHNAG